MELIQLAKRKIQCAKYSQTDQGKIKVKTHKGWVRPNDNDWLIPVTKDEHGDILYGFISEAAMEFLMKKDLEDSK